MKLFLPLLALLSVGLAQNYVERQCACTLSTLWLDVVVVIDTSAGMTVNGIQEAAANIIGVFAQSTISQQTGQTTRVGIVSYANQASTLAELTYFNSTDDLLNQMFTLIPMQTTGDQSYLKTGLSQAQTVLKTGRPMSTRSNVKQVILVYASDFIKDGVNDPTALASEIKESGIDIVTVAFDQGGEPQILQGLQSIATRNMGYSNKDADVTGEIQKALCQANCFCPNTWQQFTNTYSNATMGYGTCLKLGELDAIWLAARGACNALYANAYLATEFDSTKHNFNAAMLKADPTTGSVYSFHIGLSFNKTINYWQWEQPNSNKLIADQSAYAYMKWNSGYPDATYNNPNQGCVINTQAGTSFSLGWQNENCISVAKRYMCQVNSCDTDNYCTFSTKP